MRDASQPDRGRRDRLMIGLLYLLAWGALLVNRGLFWDDWTLVGSSPAQLIAQFSELGMPWVALLHLAIFSLPLPGLVGHVVTFCVYLASALVFHAVLRRIPGLTSSDALVGAVTFAVFPVNFARVALIDLPYGLSLLAFLAATWLLIRYVEEGGRARRVGALVLYVSSFTTASLLVLYVVPIALAAGLLARSARMPIGLLAIRHADFLVLPVGFWLAKAALFAPSGVYEGYNALTLRGLTNVPQAMGSIPSQVLAEPLTRALTVAGLPGLVVGAVVALWLVRRVRADMGRPASAALIVALGGVLVLAFGVVAYLAVDRKPEIWDWSSRHQLLVPLGAGILAVAAMRGVRVTGRVALVPGAALGVAVGLLLGASIVADARTLVAYQLDWFKQVALIDAARLIPEVGSARHIRIVDTARSFNALRRTYRFYEYNALFSQAVGDEHRLVAERATDPSARNLGDFISHPAYHMSQYVPSPVDLELLVSAPSGSPGVLRVLELVALEALGSRSFQPGIGGLIDVRVLPGSMPAP